MHLQSVTSFLFFSYSVEMALTRAELHVHRYYTQSLVVWLTSGPWGPPVSHTEEERMVGRLCGGGFSPAVKISDEGRLGLHSEEHDGSNGGVLVVS